VPTRVRRGKRLCHGEISMWTPARLRVRRSDRGGHTHARVNTVVHGIPIVEAQSSGRSVGIVDFVRTAPGECACSSSRRTPTGQTGCRVDRRAQPPAKAVRNITERVVGRLKSRCDGPVTSMVGPAIADAQRAAGRPT